MSHIQLSKCLKVFEKPIDFYIVGSLHAAFSLGFRLPGSHVCLFLE